MSNTYSFCNTNPQNNLASSKTYISNLTNYNYPNSTLNELLKYTIPQNVKQQLYILFVFKYNPNYYNSYLGFPIKKLLGTINLCNNSYYIPTAVQQNTGILYQTIVPSIINGVISFDWTAIVIPYGIVLFMFVYSTDYNNFLNIAKNPSSYTGRQIIFDNAWFIKYTDTSNGIAVVEPQYVNNGVSSMGYFSGSKEFTLGGKLGLNLIFNAPAYQNVQPSSYLYFVYSIGEPFVSFNNAEIMIKKNQDLYQSQYTIKKNYNITGYPNKVNFTFSQLYLMSCCTKKMNENYCPVMEGSSCDNLMINTCKNYGKHLQAECSCINSSSGTNAYCESPICNQLGYMPKSYNKNCTYDTKYCNSYNNLLQYGLSNKNYNNQCSNVQSETTVSPPVSPPVSPKPSPPVSPKPSPKSSPTTLRKKLLDKTDIITISLVSLFVFLLIIILVIIIIVTIIKKSRNVKSNYVPNEI